MHEGKSSSRCDDTELVFDDADRTSAIGQLNEIDVSDRATLEGLTQFRFVSPRACG